MREPAFWWREAGAAAGALSPFAAIYGAVAKRRMLRPGRRVGVPIVCIGNPIVGGAGKTPLALTVARMLAAAGKQPALLSRGYGGSLSGPVQVDLARHRAADVGDEPLLLARMAPTIVARDRTKGAAMALTAGAGVIVMDDGFQNSALMKDFSVLVVDARRGLGNGAVIPAGPLRAPLDLQLARADALVLVGESDSSAILAKIADCRIPRFRASLVAETTCIAALSGGRVLAFAGIGDPEKFFATLRNAGITVAATRRFADHHRYSRREAQDLCAQANRDNLILVTTEKDAVRLRDDEQLAELAARVKVLPATLVLEEEAAFKTLLLEKVAQARGRLEKSSA
jgi:tetraacyldisaccharide 4'-kinase